MHPSKIGYFVWCWNDAELLRKALPSFRKTTDVYLLGISNMATDGSRDVLDAYCDDVLSLDTPHSIPQCVNVGYNHVYEKGYSYLGWIHPDMSFAQKGWIHPLRNTLLMHSHIGRISPYNIGKYGPAPSRRIYPGAEAGCLIRRASWTEVGAFDERYVGCGGYEDWDIQRRFIAVGQACCITTASEMSHTHMGTRSKIDHTKRHEQWTHNQGVYGSKWGTFENAMAPDDWVDINLT